MVLFLESREEVVEFFGGSGQMFLIPILSDHHLHWSINRVSFVYLCNLQTFQDAVISFHHNDCCNVEISILSDFFGLGGLMYRKKYLSVSEGDYEAETAFWLETNERLDPPTHATILQYHRTFHHRTFLNDSIPIMKWVEHCREIRDKFTSVCLNVQINPVLEVYSGMVDELAKIEKNGIFSLN